MKKTSIFLLLVCLLFSMLSFAAEPEYKIIRTQVLLADLSEKEIAADWTGSLKVVADICSNGAVRFSGNYRFEYDRFWKNDVFSGDIAFGTGNISVDDKGKITFTPPMMIDPSDADAGVFLTGSQVIPLNADVKAGQEQYRQAAILNFTFTYFAEAEPGFMASLFQSSGNKLKVEGQWSVPVYIAAGAEKN